MYADLSAFTSGEYHGSEESSYLSLRSFKDIGSHTDEISCKHKL